MKKATGPAPVGKGKKSEMKALKEGQYRSLYVYLWEV